MTSKLKKILFIILGFILLLFGCGFIFLKTQTYSPSPFAQNYLISNKEFTVEETQDYIIFKNNSVDLETAYLFYPGGLVEAKSYAPLCAELAKARRFCIILKMPLNLAVLNINAAEKAITEFSSFNNWIIGGHSLGGSMAARFIQTSQSPKIKGLFLLGSYSDVDISNKQIQVVSIIGTLDALINKSNYNSYMNNLPSSTKYVEIQGGNHSQMGSYGQQKGDNSATIPEVEQLNQIVTNLLEY